MKKLNLLAIVAILVIVGCSKSEQPAEQKEAKQQASPKVEVIGGTSYDFGTIIQGDKVEHIFKVKNTGNADLNLGNPRTSCGCTASVVKNKVVKPGEVGEIKVIFNSAGRRGKQKKTIRVPVNVPEMKELVLTITGEVKTEIEFEPRNIRLGVAKVGQKFTQKVKIKNTGQQPVKILKTDVRIWRNKDVAEVKTDLKEGTVVEPGKEVEFSVIIVPKKPSPYFNGSIAVQTDHPKQKHMILSFFGKIADKSGVVPKPQPLNKGKFAPPTPIKIKGKNIGKKLNIKIPQIKQNNQNKAQPKAGK